MKIPPLTKRQKKSVRSIGITLLIIIIFWLSFSDTPREWLRGQFNITPILENGLTTPDPDIEIWKLTNLPSVSPPGTIVIEEKVVTDEQSIMDIAVQAVEQDAELRQIAFEVDLDDREDVLSPAEESLLNSLDHLTLITEQGNKLSTAKFELINNKVLAIFRNTGIQLEKGNYASLKIRVRPLPAVQQEHELRLQLTLDQTFATLPNGSEALIFADLGQNNNGKLADDFLASDPIQLR